MCSIKRGVFPMNHLKRIVAALLCSVVIAAPMGVMNAEAATFSQVNADTVFINQQKSYSCTLAANVMMLFIVFFSFLVLLR